MAKENRETIEVDGIIVDAETGEIIREAAEKQGKASDKFEDSVEEQKKATNLFAQKVSELVAGIAALGKKMIDSKKQANFEYSKMEHPREGASASDRAKYAKAGAADNVKKTLFDDLSKQEKIIMQQLTTKTKTIFGKLRDDLITGLGSMGSAEVVNKIDAHISKMNRVIQDSIIYGIGIPKEKLEEQVRKMNSDFAASMSDMVAKQAKGGVMPGPTTDDEKLSFATHIGSVSLSELATVITGLNEDTEKYRGSLVSIAGIMEELVNNEISLQHFFSDIDHVLKRDKELEKGLPGVKKVLKDVRDQYSTYGAAEDPRQTADLVSGARRTVSNAQTQLGFDPSVITTAVASMAVAVGSLVNSIEETETAIHSIAVISSFSSEQTALFRESIVGLSMDLPYASREIANVYGEIIKTGRGFEEAGKMVKDIANLAMATFEPIEHIGQNVTALMNAMEMGADKTREVTQGLFNVLSSTPLGFDSMAAALTQTGAAFNSLLDTTNKSGDELESYRSELMKTQMAMVGGMSLLGKTGSQAKQATGLNKHL